MTDATPAAFGARRQPQQLRRSIADDYFNASRPNVIFGGGQTGFDAAAATAAGYTTVTNPRSSRRSTPRRPPRRRRLRPGAVRLRVRPVHRRHDLLQHAALPRGDDADRARHARQRRRRLLPAGRERADRLVGPPGRRRAEQDAAQRVRGARTVPRRAEGDRLRGDAPGHAHPRHRRPRDRLVHRQPEQRHGVLPSVTGSGSHTAAWVPLYAYGAGAGR